MISAGELRKGVTFKMDGGIWSVVDFQHVKPGKGSAFVRTKIKNIVTGQTIERTFNPTEKFEPALIEFKDMQYLYSDDGLYYFMDMVSFEQIPLNGNQVEESLPYMLENCMVKVKFNDGVPFSLETETFVNLKIVECDPGVAGDTSKNVTKPAKLETGFEIAVPLFVNNGETIKVDTRTGEYVERVK